jgi:tetratricopeptide (TPR) repeat protein
MIPDERMNKVFLFFKTNWLTSAGLLIALLLTAYFPVFQYGFIWDDDAHLTDNPLIIDFEGLKRLWLDVRSRQQYYPLISTSFWVEYQFWGLDPLGYHIDNVLLHALNSIVLWRILVFLGVPAAWLVAAVFALHPVHVESVAWITERKNLLSGFFYLLSLYTFLRFYFPGQSVFSNEDPVKNRSGLLYGLSLFFFFCALSGKTVTCTLPAAVLLLFWWKQNRIHSKIIWLMVPYFVIGLGFATLTIGLEKSLAGAFGPEWDYSFWDRFLIAGRALWFYIGKLIWPYPLIFIYPMWNIDDSVWWQYLYPLTFLLFILILWALRKKIGRGPLTAILFFAGSVLPALGFFNIYFMRYSLVADHFNYLASIGILLIAVAGGARLMGKSLPVFAILLLLGLGQLTWKQTSIYKNNFTLWSDTVQKNPHAWIAHNNLGIALVAEGKIEEAISHYKMTIKLNPDHAKAHNNLGAALAAEGKNEEAISHYKMAIKIKPNHAEAYYNLGIALVAEGKNEEAISHYKMAIKLKPDYVDAHHNLGGALVAEGKNEEAISRYKMAIKIKPDHALAHYNLGNTLRREGRISEAISHYKIAIKLKPDFTLAYNNLGSALVAEGKNEEAISHYKMAIKIKPDYAGAYINLSSAYLNKKNFKLSLKTLNTLESINPNHPLLHYNFSCYYALLGNIPKGIDSLKKAIANGFKNRQSLETDPDLENLRQNPQFNVLRSLLLAKSA